MNAITELLKLDIIQWLTGLFIIMLGITTVVSIVGKFSELIGKPFSWVKKKNEDHNLLIQTIKNLDALQKRHEEDVNKANYRDDIIKKDLEKLTAMFIDKNIDDMRWSILNFSTDLSNGKVPSRESYDYILKTYDDYEEILKENNKENGLVAESIEYIKERYHEDLKNGKFKNERAIS